ncbi:hypothetical protein AMIS_19690 [Actinoplanes missouriensis 431]|uniref:AAA+ ATPase domain-containing protein n=1 Tax=Actinoplanes missouriensis (strain ATCC 14538 / DSM 43046 / CBS 188.64 / JCM 3121 / NBRC 102363 / NCIMB 12654 / NRRL B-3342 / UNCC 431) TaxID=512565 RepID=I0H2F2_ACTM4|nr:AAA family ATPase [Actinoplanes missouriensis]BAL87189.1 hypothetical protein AMIS_19690 [Actinoplanes missouriensis 431]
MKNAANMPPIDWTDVDQQHIPLPRPDAPPEERALHDQRIAAALYRETQWEYIRQAAREAAREQLAQEKLAEQRANAANADRTYTGGSWLLDVPDETPTIWGSGSEVLWARGESLMITGPQGVGKTTLASQVLKGCLSLQDEVLGYPIEGFEGRILYLAMDRPQQARRNLARLFAGMDEHREYLDEMLRVVEGPPPADFAQSPETLRQMCDHHGAAVVVIDSMKDAAIGLSKDEVGAGYNRARQIALTAGHQLVELHHTVKSGPDGGKPNNINGVYGSTWLTSGAGSVVMLWGEPGDPEVEFIHLKQPADVVGPFKVEHNNRTGVSTRVYEESKDLLALVRRCRSMGLSAKDAAIVLFDLDIAAKVATKDINKARRRLDKYVEDGLLFRREPDGQGAGQEVRWFPVESRLDVPGEAA